MKFKTTNKEVKRLNNVRCAGYCDLSKLLVNHEPIAYTCGVYGWNYDVYSVYGLTICTGYRGMPGERLKHIREYQDKAINAVDNDEIEKLLKEFCISNGGY